MSENIFKIKNLTCNYYQKNGKYNIRKIAKNTDLSTIDIIKLLGIRGILFKQKLDKIKSKLEAYKKQHKRKSKEEIAKIEEKLKPVLKIDELNIPRNSLVVIFGKSGCGKSTLLETLGLMNKTFDNKSSIIFCPESTKKFDSTENNEFDYNTLWKRKNKKLANIRKNFFSFIFQKTNLMKNFTVIQNTSMSVNLQGIEINADDVIKKGEKIGLAKSIFSRNRQIFELSGGQQQRISFVRATLPRYEVLFGDEPTGNLDEINAKRLLKQIYLDILINVKKGQGKTAIIVTHSISTALTFADYIICLTDDSNSYKSYSSNLKKYFSQKHIDKILDKMIKQKNIESSKINDFKDVFSEFKNYDVIKFQTITRIMDKRGIDLNNREVFFSVLIDMIDENTKFWSFDNCNKNFNGINSEISSNELKSVLLELMN